MRPCSLARGQDTERGPMDQQLHSVGTTGSEANVTTALTVGSYANFALKKEARLMPSS
jgi:hypothetical protein